jgi:hypothetical protein
MPNSANFTLAPSTLIFDITLFARRSRTALSKFLEVIYCPTTEMTADILTKALARFKFKPLVPYFISA